MDGERPYSHEFVVKKKKGESSVGCAKRIAKTYYSNGRKLRNEYYYESAQGELLIKIVRFIKVEKRDAPVLSKYFQVI